MCAGGEVVLFSGMFFRADGGLVDGGVCMFVLPWLRILGDVWGDFACSLRERFCGSS